jgi:hypothetical protein
MSLRFASRPCIEAFMVFTRLELGGSVATLWLDHPEGNRINFDMRVELRDAVQRVSRSSARALLIKGEGADFCLGGDVREWPGIPSAELRPKIEVFADALEQLRRLPIPTVAAVQGGCMGGGFELALSCDLIVAAKSARFSFPEARLGILTLQGGMMLIAERVGWAKAAEMVFLSQPVSAEQLHGWNVVNLGRGRCRARGTFGEYRRSARRRPDQGFRSDQANMGIARLGRIGGRQGETLRHFDADIRNGRCAGRPAQRGRGVQCGQAVSSREVFRKVSFGQTGGATNG